MIDNSRAYRIGTAPLKLPPKFFGVHQTPAGVRLEKGASTTIVDGVIPEATPAAQMKGLILEPG
ncbi:MAG: hypothetical protein BWX80_04149 [Candidatus Hydrogenedentes bacterium ADurb.Bin101]|nr:MAG: hypothetical protein BWX80_04149 [Candidatus Hydrogenedentes bacterium ADurb.Bin101]